MPTIVQKIEIEMPEHLITLTDRAYQIVQQKIVEENERVPDELRLILTKSDFLRFLLMRGALRIIKTGRLT